MKTAGFRRQLPLLLGLMCSCFSLLVWSNSSAQELSEALPAVSVEGAEGEELRLLREELARLRSEFEAYKSAQEEKALEQELEALRQEAEQTAEQEPSQELKDKSFIFKGLGLQKLNPEISVVVDTLFTGRWIDSDEDPLGPTARDHFDANLRGLNVHFQTYLDPYTKLFAAFPVMPLKAVLGEAYITRFGVADGLSFMVGHFRQWFGELNRWHRPALDQTDFPLALRRIFGGGGLAQTGVSMEYHTGSAAASHAFFVQLTEGSNGALFEGNTRGYPSLLGRYLLYTDLSDSTYLELGLSGLVGFSDKWKVACAEGSTESACFTFEALPVAVYAAELHLLWEPTDEMRHHNFEWRNEAYLLDRSVLRPDTQETDHLYAWGFFSSVQGKLVRTLDLGLRFDGYQAAVKDYDVSGFGGHAVGGDFDAEFEWQLSPYLTWYQSPFVRARLQFDAIGSLELRDPEYAVSLQLIVAGGPHLHERY
ncbi:MAG: hypothetical protein RBU37_18135 [Myxococcota bacterium]|jgi:hypothetical protein|nr:hypothetical protein [Myxococcota bacterium]